MTNPKLSGRPRNLTHEPGNRARRFAPDSGRNPGKLSAGAQDWQYGALGKNGNGLFKSTPGFA
jgi:hypothetical protein